MPTSCPRKALLCLALSFVPAAALAQNKQGAAEFGLFTSFVRFDTQVNIDERFMPSVLVGYNFTKRHGVELMLTTGTATPDEGVSFPIDLDIWRAGYVFNAYPKEKIVSFFRLGAGSWMTDPEENPDASEFLTDSESNLLLYSGGGMRIFMKPWIAVRLAGTIDFIDVGDGIANPHVQATAELGLSFVLGGKEQAAEPEGEQKPPEEPSEQPKPEEPKAEEPKAEDPKPPVN